MVIASRHPSDVDLLNNHLIPWISGKIRKPEFIHRVDVYTADPTELTTKFLPALTVDGEQAWYFLSPVRAKGRRGPRKARTAGEGCWHSEAGSKPVQDDLGHKIGRRQSFSFVYKTDDGRSSRIRTGWLMLELGLDCEPPGASRSSEEMVLCKIYFTPRTLSAPGVTRPAQVAGGGKRKNTDDESPDEAHPVKQCCHGLPASNNDAVKEAPPVVQCNHSLLPEATASTNVVTDDLLDEHGTSGAPDSVSPPTSSSESPSSSPSSTPPPSPTSSTSPITLPSSLMMPRARAPLEKLSSSPVPAEEVLPTVPADSSTSSALAAETPCPYFILPSLDYTRQEVYVICRGSCSLTHKVSRGDCRVTFEICKGDCQGS
jgi:hypothetical protein